MRDAVEMNHFLAWLLGCLRLLRGSRIALFSILMVVAGCRGQVASSTAASPGGCPAAVERRVDGLYGWYLRSGDHYRERLHEQEAALDPALFRDLQQVFSVDPERDGQQGGAGAAFDMDPFSGVQVATFAYQLTRCRVLGENRIAAHVELDVGLSANRKHDQQQITVLMQRAGEDWKVSDLEYGANDGEDAPRSLGLKASLKSWMDAHAPREGQVLLTPGFKIVITRHCAEGMVVCDQVSYRGEDRQTGSSITLMGSTLYRSCSDGMTPCQFLGYVFKNGSTTYDVSNSGLLRVLQDNKVLLEEQGEWL